MDTMIVTGGAGFIGSNFVRLALSQTDARVVVLDKLTYAGSLENLEEVRDHPRFTFVRGDISQRQTVVDLYRTYAPKWVLNFAAESHVDRSIDNPGEFVETNIRGTFELLEGARSYLKEKPAELARSFRFLHVSTDEVFGSLGKTGFFCETTPYAPNSPYAASKAAADHLVRAYYHTYGLPALVTNCSNNFGPFQFPEKLIPLMILNAVEGQPLPIYGDGSNVRDWLYVQDHCEGLLVVLEKGRVGENYNIGGHNERTNLEIVDTICSLLEKELPAKQNEALSRRGVESYCALRSFVEDRPGHDRRYAIDARKIHQELGWTPRRDFQSGLRETVHWYLDHRDWCRAVAGSRRPRLGLGDGAPTD